MKKLEGFLGIAGYYRRFIQNFGGIVGPLTDLLKFNAFKWTSTASDAFENLKKALTQAPILALSDFTKCFTIKSYASDNGIGAVLM